MFELTKWHEENPNDWVALEMTDVPKQGWVRNPNKYILRGRNEDLSALCKEAEGKDYTFAKAWMMGIGKDMKIGESNDEYRARLELTTDRTIL